MKKIIHLSDLHVGYDHCLTALNRIVTNMIYIKQPAADYVVVITGDLVEDATVDGLYEQALSEVNRLRAAGFTVLICPGNHDYGTGALGDKQYVARFAGVFLGSAAQVYPVVDVISDIAFIGLDTMAKELTWYDRIFAEGSLGKKQLSRLQALLTRPDIASAQKRVVYMHHHPFDPRPLHLLKDSEELGETLQNKVDALLFSHNHDGKCWNGKWGIPVCFDAGSSTRKEIDDPSKLSPHRVIDLSVSPAKVYDGGFH